MFALHTTATQGIESIRLLIVMIVLFAVVFWRIMLRIVIIVVASMVLIGAVVFLSDLLHFFG
jgi:hypothetical protein